MHYIVTIITAVSVIENFVAPVGEEITQSAYQVKIKLISKLIKGISRVLQKLIKYFNGTAILTSFVLHAAGVLPVTFVLNLNDSEFVKVAFRSSV